MPPLALPFARGGEQQGDIAPAGFSRLVIYAYPPTGLPGVEPRQDATKSPEHMVAGPNPAAFAITQPSWRPWVPPWWALSPQSSACQREAAQRLRLPYALLRDARLQLTAALTLPTFTVQARPQHDGGGPPRCSSGSRSW